MTSTFRVFGLLAGAFFLVLSLTGCPDSGKEPSSPDTKTDKAKLSAPAPEEETPEEEDDMVESYAEYMQEVFR